MAALVITMVGPVSKEVLSPSPVEAHTCTDGERGMKATPEVIRVKNNRS
jgi:hypothetical protein